MTLEFLELMEDIKNQENEVQGTSSPRRKLQKSFKSNTRIYDDGSIEVDPQAQGEPSQKDGKNPLTCVELKCPENVTDKAAFFHKELAKLTKDIQIEEPTLPKGEFLINNDRLKVCLVKGEKNQLTAWLTFEAKGLLEIRRELYSLTSEIDKCFVINEASVCQLKS